MKILKFGGASVKDAKGVRNLFSILQKTGYNDALVVISAMGKMTNAFEEIVNAYYNKKPELYKKIEFVVNFHTKIANDLFMNRSHYVYQEIQSTFDDLNLFIDQNSNIDYNYIYDQIVGNAEILSTKISSIYLLENGIENEWLDVRKCIQTDSNYRSAKVNWNNTCSQINHELEKQKLYITQGFIASDNLGRTTTLGREGSDYTAGIFAYCLQAKEVIIYKDVPGVLNADPRVFDQTILLNQISYKEAIEMAFYGASVIHPKTLQPLQRMEIPLFVKSFKDPLLNGTSIRKGITLEPKTSCFIVKKDQILLSISDKEFAFIMEDDISEIFDFLHQFRIKVNLIQNSAISFSVCIEDNFNSFKPLLEKLKSKYRVLYNRDLTLYTIRHFTKDSLNKIEEGKKIILKQLSRETAQIIVLK